LARTRFEIEEELGALNDLRAQVPPKTAFGDDNQDAIDAQIRVIEQRMTFEEAIDEFEEDGDYILSNAQDAVRWLVDDDVPVSESWRELADAVVEAVA
jgi:hypothetical protein